MTIPLTEATAEQAPRLVLGPEPLCAFAHHAVLESAAPNSQIVQSLGAAAAMVRRAIDVGSPDQLTEEPLLICKAVAGSPPDMRALDFLHGALPGVHIVDPDASSTGLDCTSFVTAQEVAGIGLLGVRFVRTLFRPDTQGQITIWDAPLQLPSGCRDMPHTAVHATYSMSAGYMT